MRCIEHVEMKLFITIFMLLFFSLYSKDFPVMLKVKSTLKIDNNVLNTFRSGVEDILTSKGYTLISVEQQNEAIKEQAKQQNSDCYDDACLVTTGKMMSAKMIFIIDIIKMDNEYVFKSRLVDLETGSTKRTSTEIYQKKLTKASSLLKFSKSLAEKTLNKKMIKKDFDNQAENLKVHDSDLIKVIVSSEPEGATIFVDDKFIGKSRAQTTIKKGSHKFKLKLKHYEDRIYEKELYVDNEELVTLDPKAYQINIKTNPSASSLYYNDAEITANKDNSFDFHVYAQKIHDIKIKKAGYYDKTIRLSLSDLEKLKTLNIELKEVPRYTITLNMKQDNVDIYSGCQVTKLSKNKFKISDYVNSVCTVNFTKNYFIEKSINLEFIKNQSLDISLKEYEKFNLKFDLSPIAANIVLENNITKEEFFLKSGLVQSLYEGEYSYYVEAQSIKNKSYNTEDANGEIFLNEDKIVNIRLPRVVEFKSSFLKPYFLTNIIKTNSSTKVNIGLGLNLFEFSENSMILSLDTKFLRDLKNMENNFELIIDIKKELFKDFRIGESSSLIFSENNMKIVFNLLLEYKYDVSKDLFFKPELKFGFSPSVGNDSDTKDIFFILAGISFGWNGF